MVGYGGKGGNAVVGKYTYLFLHPLWVPEGSISDLSG
jgi:hypothetical protein